MTDDHKVKIGGSEVDPDELEWTDVYKKPLQVEAVQIPAPFQVETLEGTMEADANDWLVKGIQGEYYPVDIEIFARTYANDGQLIPKYSERALSNAMRELGRNTLEHIPENTSSSDARAGARALLKLIKDQR
jgi:hypothetical protein